MVTFVGLAMAALSRPQQGWFPALILTGVLVLQVLSIPASIYARGRTRAFYVGFSITGWGYFLIAYTPWFEATLGSQLLAYPIAESICYAATNSLGDSQYYLRVCHALILFLLACVGGFTAERFYLHHSVLPSATGHDSIHSSDFDDHLPPPSEGLSLRKAQ